MQTKVSNNSKRYIYRKNALGRDKSVMGQMAGAVKNYIKQKNEQRRLTAKEYRKTVRPIATKPVVQSMKKFNHHSQTSCFKHSVHVSYMNYIVCKNLDWTIMRQQKQGFCTICFFMTGMGTNLKKENACMDLNIRIKP